MKQNLQINFSAVVVCYNEAHLLRQCLASLDFCKEFIIVDLGSTDKSIEVAKEFKAKIYYHELVPYPNLPRQYGIKQAKYDWVITIDPDEVFPKHEIEKIEDVIRRDSSTLAGIRLPWQFYFRGKELRSSIWGRPNATRCAVVHRERIETTPFVHKEFSHEQSIYHFAKSEITPLQHYWMNSYQQLFEKMWRYIQNEGKSKYEAQDQRFSWYALFKHTVATLKLNLIDYQGLSGGFTGLFLSFFHTWYVFMSWLSLRQYEHQMRARDKKIVV